MLTSAAFGRGRGANESAGPDNVSAVRRRLEGELKRLRGAPAAVVLGVPTGADADLVERAAARMRNRYRSLSENGALPANVRDLASEMGHMVQSAHKRMSLGGARGPASSVPPLDSVRSGAGDDPFSNAAARGERLRPEDADPDQLLAMGRELLAKRDWRRADRVLTKAHNQRIGHASTLANLAWARLHNQSRPADKRREDALDFLLLAEQFDASDAEAQGMLARFLLDAGDPVAALPRARRAARLRPDDADLSALLETIEGRLPDD